MGKKRRVRTVRDGRGDYGCAVTKICFGDELTHFTVLLRGLGPKIGYPKSLEGPRSCVLC